MLMANGFPPSQQHEGTVDLWSISTKLASAMFCNIRPQKL